MFGILIRAVPFLVTLCADPGRGGWGPYRLSAAAPIESVKCCLRRLGLDGRGSGAAGVTQCRRFCGRNLSASAYVV